MKRKLLEGLCVILIMLAVLCLAGAESNNWAILYAVGCLGAAAAINFGCKLGMTGEDEEGD